MTTYEATPIGAHALARDVAACMKGWKYDKKLGRDPHEPATLYSVAYITDGVLSVSFDMRSGNGGKPTHVTIRGNVPTQTKRGAYIEPSDDHTREIHCMRSRGAAEIALDIERRLLKPLATAHAEAAAQIATWDAYEDAKDATFDKLTKLGKRYTKAHEVHLDMAGDSYGHIRVDSATSCMIELHGVTPDLAAKIAKLVTAK